VLVIVVWLAVAGFATLELAMSGVPRADNPFLPAIAASALLFGTKCALTSRRRRQLSDSGPLRVRSNPTPYLTFDASRWEEAPRSVDDCLFTIEITEPR
jgi:hypothetical protein